MQVSEESTKLLSLLVVFLTENYEYEMDSCDDCGCSQPQFGKVFHIDGHKVCLGCVLNRIENR